MPQTGIVEEARPHITDTDVNAPFLHAEVVVALVGRALVDITVRDTTRDLTPHAEIDREVLITKGSDMIIEMIVMDAMEGMNEVNTE